MVVAIAVVVVVVWRESRSNREQLSWEVGCRTMIAVVVEVVVAVAVKVETESELVPKQCQPFPHSH